MAYSIVLPDGAVVENIPDEVTPSDAKARIIAKFPQYGPKPEDQSVFRQVADVPLGVAKGIAQGVRMGSDIFGAGSESSKNIKGVEDYISGLMSAQSRLDQQEIARIQKEAEDKGIWDQVKAGAKSFAVAPIDTLSSAVGTAVPVIAAGLGATAFGAPAAAVTGIGALVSAGLGAGTIKGSIYEATKQALQEAGASPQDAEQKAIQAQEYGGKNLDQIILGTVIGGVAGVGPLEKGAARLIANKISNKVATETSEAAAKGAVRKRIEAGVKESVPEALQAGQEQVAQNIALQREGMDVPTFRGAVGAATLEGLAGAGLGAAIGGSGYKKDLIEGQREGETLRQAAERTQQELLDLRAMQSAQASADQEAAQQAAQTGISSLLGGIEPTRQQRPSEQSPAAFNNLLAQAAEVAPQDQGIQVLLKAAASNSRAASESPANFNSLLAQTALTESPMEKGIASMLAAPETRAMPSRTSSPAAFDTLLAPEITPLPPAAPPAMDPGLMDILRATGGQGPSRVQSPSVANNLLATEPSPAAPPAPPVQDPGLAKILQAIGGRGDSRTQSPSIANNLLAATPEPEAPPAPPVTDPGLAEILKAIGSPQVTKTKSPSVANNLLAAQPAPAAPPVAVPGISNILKATGQQAQRRVNGPLNANNLLTPEPIDASTEAEPGTAEADVGPATGAGVPVVGQPGVPATPGVKQPKPKPGGLGVPQPNVARPDGGKGVLPTPIATPEQSSLTTASRTPAQQAALETAAITFPQSQIVDQVDGQLQQLTNFVNQQGESITAPNTKTTPPLVAKARTLHKSLLNEGMSLVDGVHRNFLGEADATPQKVSELQKKVTDRLEAAVDFGKQAPKKSLASAAEEVDSPEAQDASLNAQIDTKIKQLGGILTKIMSNMGMRDVALNIVDDLKNANAEYANQLIRLAIDAQSPVRDLRHESIHAMKEMGFFSDKQWATLEKMANDKWIKQYLGDVNVDPQPLEDGEQSRLDAYKEMFKTQGLSDADAQAALVEEAIADAFGTFDVQGAPSGMLSAILKRMKSLFAAIKSAFGGTETAEQILQKAEKGQLQGAKRNAPKEAEQPEQPEEPEEPKVSLRGKYRIDKTETEDSRTGLPKAAWNVVDTEDGYVYDTFDRKRDASDWVANAESKEQSKASLRRAAVPDETEISTQNPQAVNRRYDPIEQMLSIDQKAVEEAMELNPELYDSITDAILRYGFIPPDTKREDAISVFKKNIVNNLLFLHDAIPKDIANRSKLWYDGAHIIAKEMAKQYDMKMEQVAGIFAAMSPQKDWFQNVSMGERAIDILTNQGDATWDDNMLKYAESYIREPKDRKEREKRQIFFDKNIRQTSEDQTALKDMDIENAAAFIRAFDEAYNSRQYRIVTPEGGFAGLVNKKDGDPAIMTWSTYGPIEKAVSIFRDPSRKNISEQLGEEHKIRSFYNNIAAPNADIDHVTIDTHAVAAGLFEALAGSDTPVAENFGSTGGTNLLGVGGTYGIIADAYREAAKARGVQAREMQSITWEAIRGLFTEEFKSGIKSDVRAEWEKYKAGEQSFNEARDAIVEIASKNRDEDWRDPDWIDSGPGQTVADGGASYDKDFVPEGGVRLREESVLREKLTFNLSAVTNSIPGLKDLYQKAMSGDQAAYSTLQKAAESSLRYLLSGTSARITVDYAKGVYLSDREPSIAAKVAFSEEDRPAVLAALERFASNYNQYAVHVRQGTAYPLGTEFDDGSYATAVFTIDLQKNLTNEEIGQVLTETNLEAFTVVPTKTPKGIVNQLVAYWCKLNSKPQEEQEDDFKQFKANLTKAAKLVGVAGKKPRKTIERLFVYADDDERSTHTYGRIRGDVSPKQSADTATPRIIADYLLGEEGKTFPPKKLNKFQVTGQKLLADVFEALPINDLKTPIVRKAYNALNVELVKQFNALPVKVDAVDFTGKDSVFKYKGTNNAGSEVSGEIAAKNEDEAKAKLKAQEAITATDLQVRPEPYPTSAAMRKDVSENNRLKIYKTQEGTFGPEGVPMGDHPLLEDSGLKDINNVPLLYNDLLRAVHDYYAHGVTPAEFGPKGEASAWLNHMASTMSPLARWAITAETRAQNAWTNFRPGAEEMLLKDRGFSLQKAALPPVQFALTGDKKVDAPMQEFIAKLTPKQQLGSLSPKSPLVKKIGPATTAKFSIRAKADQLKAMSDEQRDDIDPGEFGWQAYTLYEAEKTMPKKDGQFKRVTASNSFVLYQEADYVVNVDGKPFLAVEEEDPDQDEAGDEEAKVWSFQDPSDPDGKSIITDFADKADAVSDLKSKLPAKLSIRAPNTKEFKQWFGKSTIVDAEGNPKVMYHGTARDITAFRAKQANAIFITEEPTLAENYAYASADWMAKNEADFFTPEEKADARRQVIESLQEQNKSLPKSSKDFNKQVIAYLKTGNEDAASDVKDFARESLIDVYVGEVPRGANILPVFVKAENPFDYDNAEHIAKIEPTFRANENGSLPRNAIQNGLWSVIESDGVQKAIRESGFDGFYVEEGGIKNLAVYNPEQIKSATGNQGTFDINNPDIRKSLRSSAKLSDDRIDALVDNYGYWQPGSENDTRNAYISLIKPKDFLNATSTEAYRKVLESEKQPLDADKLAKGEMPHLRVKKDAKGNYQILSHEGRHRMMALRDSGVQDAVPVLVLPSPIDGRTENAPVIEGPYFKPQVFSDGPAVSGAYGSDMVPITWNSRTALKKNFGGEAEVKFSLRSKGEPVTKGNVVAAMERAHEQTPYMNCQLALQMATGVSKLRDLPKVKSAQVGDIYTFNETKTMASHYAVELGDGNVAEVEQWGEAPRVVPLQDVVAEYDEPSAIRRPPDTAYTAEAQGAKASLRSTLPRALMQRIDQTTTARKDEGHVGRMISAISPGKQTTFRAELINRYDALDRLDKIRIQQMGGAAAMADISSESAALLSDLGAGITASALGVHDKVGGVPVYVQSYYVVRNGQILPRRYKTKAQAQAVAGANGEVRSGGHTAVGNFNNTVKGPLAIFAPLAKINDPDIYRLYQFWAAAKRAKRFDTEGREFLLDPKGPDAAHAADIERRFPVFVDIQKEWTKYNDKLVQYMVDTGVLTPEKGKIYTQYSDYIPFYRQVEGERTAGPNIFAAISSVKAPKEAKGSKAPLDDFLETIVRNTQSAVQAGVKNIAAQRAVEAAKDVGLAVKLPAGNGLPSTVTVLENGVPTHYDCKDALFVNAMKSLGMAEIPFLNIISAPANWLRAAVTKEPTFMLANLLRDSLSSYVTSGVKMTPIVDTMANFAKTVVGMSPEFDILRRAGVVGGYDYAQGVEISARKFGEQLNKAAGVKSKGLKRVGKAVVSPVTGIWNLLEKGSEASDAATRQEVYKKTLAETGNETEALFRSLEVMNFNRKGRNAGVRLFTAMIPFLNARMQGLDILYRTAIRPSLPGQSVSAREKELQHTFMVRGATMAALSCMYWMMTNDDDEYKKQEEDTKDNFWLIPSLGVKIPTPFEVGFLFKIIPERIMALTFGDDTFEDFRNSMTNQIVSTLKVNPIPQAVLPALENLVNVSAYTMRPIVSPGLEGLEAGYQVSPNTTTLMSDIGKAVGMSPIKLEHAIQGYTGQMGMYLVSLLDAVYDINSTTPRPSKQFEKLPMIKRFAVDPNARGSVTAFYKLKDEVDTAVKTINMLERTGDFEEYEKYMTENMNLLATKEYVQQLATDMKDLAEIKAMIRSSEDSAEEKGAALLEVQQMENDLTENIKELRQMARATD